MERLGYLASKPAEVTEPGMVVVLEYSRAGLFHVGEHVIRFV